MKINFLFFGVTLFFISLVQAFVYDWAHYYAFFSLGLFFILLDVYHRVKGEGLFEKWNVWYVVLFWALLFVASVFIDAFGMDAEYWMYPDYVSLFDNVLKYVFEWSVALAYHMVGLMIGMEFCRKRFGMSKLSSFVVSLFVFVSLIGLFTEWVNLFVESWVVLDMPLWNFKVGGFFVMFQTVGYWAMAVVPYLIYNLVGGFRK